jgi:hypothetical protein
MRPRVSYIAGYHPASGSPGLRSMRYIVHPGIGWFRRKARYAAATVLSVLESHPIMREIFGQFSLDSYRHRLDWNSSSVSLRMHGVTDLGRNHKHLHHASRGSRNLHINLDVPSSLMALAVELIQLGRDILHCL